MDGAAPAHPSNSVQREMDWFRRSQGLPYWHHDRRSDWPRAAPTRIGRSAALRSVSRRSWRVVAR